MSGQEAIDGAVGDRLLRFCLKRLLDLGSRRQLSPCRAGQEGLEEGAFLLQGQVLVAPPASPRRFHGGDAQPIVGGDNAVDGRGRDAHRPGNVFGLARVYQRLIDDLPALAAPGARFSLQALQDRLQGHMKGGAGDAVSHAASLLFFTGSFLEYHAERVVWNLYTQPLMPLLPALVESLEWHEHLHLTGECRTQLLAMSPATADRLLRPSRKTASGGFSADVPRKRL
jgi:hypothetical protein